MKKMSECLFIWGLGGTLYYMIEIAFRGYSHWSMFILGGIGLLFCAFQGLWTRWQDPLWRQVLRCVIFITAGEFLTGILVNKVMRWNVWDYSSLPLQLMGQISVPFMILFSGLCVLGILLGKFILQRVYLVKKC